MNQQKPLIALQLYTLRDLCAERGLPDVLKEVAKIGYDGVEFAGFHNMRAELLKDELDKNELQVAGAHIPLDDFLEKNLPETVRYNHAIGNRTLICPALPEPWRDSIASWRKSAAFFSELAAELGQHGLRLGYHNHTIEFQPMEGVLPWDVFYGNTKKEIIMQLDTGNALAVGVDVAPFIERYPGRSLTVHLKDWARDGKSQPLIGEGDVNWTEIFRLCHEIGATEWYIVEQESDTLPALECAARSLENLRHMLQTG